MGKKQAELYGLQETADTGKSIVDRCNNFGSIAGNEFAGGIAGECFIGQLYIYNCLNGIDTKITGGRYVGGILGGLSTYGKVNILNSYSFGILSGTTYVGGISGYTCAGGGNGDGTTNIYNSYFAGTIQNGINIGGVLGYNNNGTISIDDCYYINTIAKGISNADTTGITALSENDMKWNNTLLEYLNSYKNSEYELLSWKKGTNQFPEFDL